MANPVCDVFLTEQPLRSRQSESANPDPGCGAMVDFQGIVRLSENDREIDGIEYEANHEMALHQLRMIAREAITQFSLHLVILHHRIGFVPTGEASLFLRAGCGHRQAAFKASEWIVNELKRRVPIWKKPRYKIGNKPPGRRQEALSA